jgi:hypothetical protein
MAYILPSDKPISPSPVDLGTRVLSEPSPVVTVFQNSGATYGYFTCFFQRKYSQMAVSLNCIVTDGQTVYQYAWNDPAGDRQWKDMQIQNGMDSNHFYLIGISDSKVDVLYIFVDNQNSIIKIDKQETLD